MQLTLALAKRAPLVLFVDDLQWADSATLDLLQYAIRRWRDAASSGAGLAVGQPAVRSFAPDDPTPASGWLQGGSTGLIQWLTRVGRELTPGSSRVGAVRGT